MSQNPILRRCVSCRKLLDRQQLFRIIRDHKDGVVLDKGMGRSAYVCRSEDCLEDSWRRKQLQKALRCQVPEIVIEMLQKRLKHCNASDIEAI